MDCPVFSLTVNVTEQVEAAMGTPTLITCDDPQLKKAPPGTDSVVAIGRVDPDPAGDKVVQLDGRDVIVPAGRINLSTVLGAQTSTFIQSEHLIYNESQVCAALSISPVCSRPHACGVVGYSVCRRRFSWRSFSVCLAGFATRSFAHAQIMQR